MKIAICDDIPQFNLALKKCISTYMRSHEIIEFHIEVYSSGSQLIRSLEKERYDFIFLDVDMPQLSGFETAEKVKQTNPDTFIIFATNQEMRMGESFKYSPKDYLLKPVAQEKINELFDRLFAEKMKKTERGFYTVKIKNDGNIYLRLDDIVYFESQGHDLTAVTGENQYTFLGKLSAVEKELLSKGFIRIHQSYLLNMSYVFKDLGSAVVLKNSQELPVSTKYKKSLSSAFKERVSTKWI